MLAASVFYGWPALLTFGFSGNPALLLLVLNCHDCCLFESNKYLLLLLLLIEKVSGKFLSSVRLHRASETVRLLKREVIEVVSPICGFLVTILK